MLHYGAKKPSPSHVVQEEGKKTTRLTSVLVRVAFTNCLEVRVNGSDVEVEKSAMRSREARLNPFVRLPWCFRYQVGYNPACELQLCSIWSREVSHINGTSILTRCIETTWTSTFFEAHYFQMRLDSPLRKWQATQRRHLELGESSRLRWTWM